MEDILINYGYLPYVIVAWISFLLGILSSYVIDWIREIIDKRRLLDLFLDDINRNWSEVDRKKFAPTDEFTSRIQQGIKGVDGVWFVGIPEFLFEVHNLKLYETEGFRLSKFLDQNSRTRFWEVYSLMRDAEQIRQIIINLSKDDQDIYSYAEVFNVTITKLAEAMARLWDCLFRERLRIKI